VPADARSLGLAVADAVRQAAANGPTGFVPLADGALGGPLDAAVDAVATALEAGTTAPSAGTTARDADQSVNDPDQESSR